jgi:hypothetical protein
MLCSPVFAAQPVRPAVASLSLAPTSGTSLAGARVGAPVHKGSKMGAGTGYALLGVVLAGGVIAAVTSGGGHHGSNSVSP